jgi:iron complex transport system substrate-binding protein
VPFAREGAEGSPIFSWGFFIWSENFLKRKFHARRITFGVLALAAVALPTQAAGTDRASTAQTSEKNSSQIVVDEIGHHVVVPNDVRRIVSIAPSVTETVYAIGADSRLVGDTDYCDFPPDARTKPHVGGVINPSLEAIAALKPDLVLATTTINREETVDALDHLGIPVYTTDPHTIDSLLAGIARLAGILGVAQHGEELVAHLRGRLDAVRTAIAGQPPSRVLFVVWDDPLISIGQNTFIADALRRAGAESVVDAKQDWPHVSLESVVHAQPEYLIYAGDHGDDVPKISDLRARPVWRDLNAVKQGKIAVVSSEVDRPDPGLIDAIETLAKMLHPAAFANSDLGKTR